MPDKYCSFCGGKMVYKEPRIQGYSTKTGKPIMVSDYECENSDKKIDHWPHPPNPGTFINAKEKKR
jgi:hypothetical protein